MFVSRATRFALSKNNQFFKRQAPNHQLGTGKFEELIWKSYRSNAFYWGSVALSVPIVLYYNQKLYCNITWWQSKYSG